MQNSPSLRMVQGGRPVEASKEKGYENYSSHYFKAQNPAGHSVKINSIIHLARNSFRTDLHETCTHVMDTWREEDIKEIPNPDPATTMISIISRFRLKY